MERSDDIIIQSPDFKLLISKNCQNLHINLKDDSKKYFKQLINQSKSFNYPNKSLTSVSMYSSKACQTLPLLNVSKIRPICYDSSKIGSKADHSKPELSKLKHNEKYPRNNINIPIKNDTMTINTKDLTRLIQRIVHKEMQHRKEEKHSQFNKPSISDVEDDNVESSPDSVASTLVTPLQDISLTQKSESHNNHQQKRRHERPKSKNHKSLCYELLPKALDIVNESIKFAHTYPPLIKYHHNTNNVNTQTPSQSRLTTNAYGQIYHSTPLKPELIPKISNISTDDFNDSSQQFCGNKFQQSKNSNFDYPISFSTSLNENIATQNSFSTVMKKNIKISETLSTDYFVEEIKHKGENYNPAWNLTQSFGENRMNMSDISTVYEHLPMSKEQSLIENLINHHTITSPCINQETPGQKKYCEAQTQTISATPMKSYPSKTFDTQKSILTNSYGPQIVDDKLTVTKFSDKTTPDITNDSPPNVGSCLSLFNGEAFETPTQNYEESLEKTYIDKPLIESNKNNIKEIATMNQLDGKPTEETDNIVDSGIYTPTMPYITNYIKTSQVENKHPSSLLKSSAVSLDNFAKNMEESIIISEYPTSPDQLTLQEALKTFRPDFIVNSWCRQQHIKLLAEKRKLKSYKSHHQHPYMSQSSLHSASVSPFSDTTFSSKTTSYSQPLSNKQRRVLQLHLRRKQAPLLINKRRPTNFGEKSFESRNMKVLNDLKHVSNKTLKTSSEDDKNQTQLPFYANLSSKRLYHSNHVLN